MGREGIILPTWDNKEVRTLNMSYQTIQREPISFMNFFYEFLLCNGSVAAAREEKTPAY